MFGATIKGMLAHKLRLFLTGTSIALGVAFLAGTLMLNDSMQRAFDDVFGSVNSGTDVAVRAQAGPVETDDPDDSRPPIPARTLDLVRGVDGVATAEGSVRGYALLTGSDGKPIQPQGAPTLGATSPPTRPCAVTSSSAPDGHRRVPVRWPSTPPRRRTATSRWGPGRRSSSAGHRRPSPWSESWSTPVRTTWAAPRARTSTSPPRNGSSTARASTTRSWPVPPTGSVTTRWPSGSTRPCQQGWRR